MPLYLDYRPSTFEEVIGNEATVSTIKNNMLGEDPPHSIILNGPSGCGKTTLGRIISSELGCKIDSLDFVELDIAQLTGVDTARTIRQNMSFLPNESDCRVWLLDEFHKASSAFQNAMLKALEDTPKHCYFIICTTELGKIIKTVQTRCSKFKVELLEPRYMNELIDWVLKGEEFEIANEVIDEIVEVADGCPREALVILDQIIDLEPEAMLEAITQSETNREVKELCQAMLKEEDWHSLRKILKGLKGTEPERTRRAITGYVQAVALNNPGKADRCAYIYDCFRDSVIHNGMPGISFAAHGTTL